MLNQTSNRRTFIKQSSVITAGTLLLPSFLKATPDQIFQGNRLVVIQFSGGNDGLNTIIPIQNDILFNARPNLAPQPKNTIQINPETGFHHAMKGIHRLFDEGDCCIINSVGYPEPNRSHFRSMDIWQSGSGPEQYWDTGWLGRYLDAEFPEKPAVPAVEMANILSLAMKGSHIKGLPLTNVGQFYQATSQLHLQESHHEHQLADFLYQTIGDTRASAKYLFEKNKIYQSKISYPDNQFANQLKEVAEMIISGVEAPVYYVTLGGFDTHNNQENRQSKLLETYSEAMSAFVKDLKQNQQWNNTLVMTFSEFGRRVKENASGGTDHGKANNVFLAGGRLKTQGFYNALPQLTNLEEGDVPFEIDFRQVYSTILENWLKTDSELVLKGKFDLLRFV